MPKYEYRCKLCEARYESETLADEVVCRTPKCVGRATRVWGARFNISNLKGAR